MADERKTGQQAPAPAAYDRRTAERPTQEQYRVSYWSSLVPRLSLRERRMHWLMAAGGILAMISGMGWYWKSTGFLLSLFGGGVSARLIHVAMGTIFSVVALALIARTWGKEILRFRPEDREWMKTFGGYLTPQREGEHHEHAPAGFFNAGQKMLGWMYVVLAAELLVTGIVIWWPELFGPTLVRLCLPLHALGFVGFSAGLVMHVYLSTAANPGTFRAMTTGLVTRLWAHDHHPLWFRKVVSAERSSTGGTPATEVRS